MNPLRAKTTPTQTVLLRWAGPILVALVGAAMLIVSWGTWPDSVVDFGRELYTPWQLTQGKALYRDMIVMLSYGPFSQYLHALLFKIFGVSLRTLVIFNLGIVAVLAALLYWLVKLAFGELAAIAGGITFLVLFAFAELTATGDYNFVCAYSYELTHGITLTVAAIACFMQWHRRREQTGAATKPWWLMATAFLLGIVALTKAEVFAAAFVTLGVAMIAEIWLSDRSEPNWRAHFARDILLAFIAFIAPVIAAVLLLTLQMPLAQALNGLAVMWRWVQDRKVLSMPLYLQVNGLFDVRESVHAILVCAGIYAVLFVPPIFAGFLGRPTAITARRIIASVWFAIVLGCGIWMFTYSWAITDFLRAMPLVLIGALVVYCIKLFKRDRTAFLPVVLLCWSLTMLARTPLNMHAYHFGFALGMPGMLVGVGVLLGEIPRALDRVGGSGIFLRAVTAAILLAALQGGFSVMHSLWEQKTLVIGKGGDSFYTTPGRAGVGLIVDDLVRSTHPDSTLVVVPDGLMINYLARRANPTGHLLYTPPAILIDGEQNILDSLRAHPPDYVISIPLPMNEFGVEAFGKDYALSIVQWLKLNYEVRRRIPGSEDERELFPLVLLNRK